MVIGIAECQTSDNRPLVYRWLMLETNSRLIHMMGMQMSLTNIMRVSHLAHVGSDKITTVSLSGVDVDIFLISGE